MRYQFFIFALFLLNPIFTYSQTIDSFEIDSMLGRKVYLLKTSTEDNIVISINKKEKLISIDLFSVKYQVTVKFNNNKKRGYELISNSPQSDTFWRIYFYRTGEFWGFENISNLKGGQIGLHVALNKRGEILEKKYY